MRVALAEDRHRPTVVDLFAGAGGLSLGFAKAGFSVVAANDADKMAVASFGANHPHTVLFDGPIQALGADRLLRAGKLRRGELDAVVGGPPCQPFSINNHQRGGHDTRSQLFREYIRIVSALMPRFVVMENVPGLASIGGGAMLAAITEGIEGIGYSAEVRILKAEDYGIPQERHRLFLVGSRDTSQITWPLQTHTAETQRVHSPLGAVLQPFVTVDEAISDLPRLPRAGAAEQAAYRSEPSTAYQRLLRAASRRVLNHVAPKLGTLNRKRIAHVPQGGSWRDIPHDLLPAGMKRARRSDHTKRYGRLHPDRQASTILTKCDIHWGAFIHPNEDRTITVREAARLQSFPDTFRFLGTRSDQYRQVGNAVPPLLGLAIAKAVRAMAEA